MLRESGFITIKPVLYVCNVDEGSALGWQWQFTETVAAYAASEGAGCIVISGQIEAEVSELEDEERDEFLDDLG